MTLLRTWSPLCTALLGLAPWLAAQDPARATAPLRRLIVLNKAEATASVYDATTRKELAVVPVGEGPHECATSADGRTAVVADYGDQKPGSTLTVLDVAGARTLRTIELRGSERAADGAERAVAYLRPHGLQFVDDRRVLVTSEAARCLLVVDLVDGKVQRALPTPQSLLHMVALAADRSRAFGTSIRDGTLAVFPLTGDGAVTTLACGKGSEGLAVAPGSGAVWVTNREADTVSICAPDGSRVLASLDTGDFPIRVAFTPDGAHALVSCAEAGVVQVFRTEDRALAHTVDLLADKTERSPLPIGICVEPEGRFAWVACNRGEWLAVVDLATWRVVDRIAARKGPDGMAFATIPAAPGPK